MAEKIKLCVLFGGESTEYEISLRSVTSVLNNLDKTKYDITTIGITRDGRWRLFDKDTSLIINDNWYSDTLKKVSPDLGEKDSSFIVTDNEGNVSKIKTDVVFPVLHGANGEDGKLQGLLELAGMKYVGVGVLCSCVSMDKAYTKIIFKDAGIDQADWVTINDYQLDNLDAIMDECEKKLGYPMFVKPSNAGSSIGIGKAKTRDELESAIRNAFTYDRRIIVEEFLNGREVECAVMGKRGNITTSCVGEILAANEFYDFEAKYSDKVESGLVIPAKFENNCEEKIRSLAIKAFNALDGVGLSRIDFFCDDKNGIIKINEINTLPGFTSISMYPKLFMNEGMTYSEILDNVIEIAVL